MGAVRGLPYADAVEHVQGRVRYQRHRGASSARLMRREGPHSHQAQLGRERPHSKLRQIGWVQPWEQHPPYGAL